MYDRTTARVVPNERKLDISWQQGTVIPSLFLVTLVIFMVLRATLQRPTLLYSLFANMFLAGTIILRGGPVAIPLFGEYVVAEGWVTPRDFLIGLRYLDFSVFSYQD